MKLEEIKVALRRMLAGLESRKKETEQAIERLTRALDYFDSVGPFAISMLEHYLNKEESQEEEEGTHFQRIVKSLQSKFPKSLAEIADATGIPRSSVSAVLYRTHRGFFQSIEVGGSPIKRWQLRPFPEEANSSTAPEPTDDIEGTGHDSLEPAPDPDPAQEPEIPF